MTHDAVTAKCVLLDTTWAGVVYQERNSRYRPPTGNDAYMARGAPAVVKEDDVSGPETEDVGPVYLVGKNPGVLPEPLNQGGAPTVVEVAIPFGKPGPVGIHRLLKVELGK